MASDLLRPLYLTVRIDIKVLEIQLDEGDLIVDAVNMDARSGGVSRGWFRQPEDPLDEGRLANADGAYKCNIYSLHCAVVWGPNLLNGDDVAVGVLFFPQFG